MGKQLMSAKPKPTPVERTPPHSIDAEQAVLGSLLLDNEALFRLPDAFASEDYYVHAHRLIHDAAVAVIATGERADAVSVMNELVRAGVSERVDGIGYLNALATNTPSAANVSGYARIVRRHAVLRRAAVAVDDVKAMLEQPGSDDPDRVFDRIEARLTALADREGLGAGTLIDMRTAVTRAVQRVEQVASGATVGLATGLLDLDGLLGGGLEPGSLTIVGGRPSSGKTTLALNLAEHAAGQGRAALIFSMEMAEEELTLKLAASHGRLDHERLRTGKLADPEFSKLAQTFEQVAHLPIFIDSRSALSVDQLRSRARSVARQKQGLGLVLVDYLQLMAVDDRGENRATALGDITRGLKGLARELKVPVVCLSQLNRKLEERLDKRPILSDLRESGAIEQDADVIVFVHREEMYNAQTIDKGVAELILAKNRTGRTGTARAAFLGRYSRFDNLART
jgi:replicative DNA helicase